MPTTPKAKPPHEFAEKLKRLIREKKGANKLSPTLGIFRGLYFPSTEPSKKITALRKAGKLKAALEYAHKSLEEDPRNDLTKTALGWVHYDYLKKYSFPEEFDNFAFHLENLSKLGLSKSENLIFDNTGRLITHMVELLDEHNPDDHRKASTLFHAIRNFSFTKSSDSYIALFKAFHDKSKFWPEYVDFVDWWDTDHFRPEDYEAPKDPNTLSIAEEAYIAYTKKLLSRKPRGSKSKSTHREKIETLILKLETTIQDHPHIQHLLYQKARLELEVKDQHEVLSKFIPKAKQKRREFWVWHVLAIALEDDKPLALACYCKAKSLIHTEDPPADLYRDFIAFLLKRKRFREAKRELEEFMGKCEGDTIDPPHQFTKWTTQKWYANTSAKADSQPFYEQHIGLAEDFLFKDITEETVVIEFVNRNKSMAHFIIDKNRYGQFKYADKMEQPEIGEIYRVRLKGDKKGDRCEVLTATKMDPSTPTKAMRHFENKLTVIPPYNYGLANNIHLDPEIIRDHNLEDGQMVAGMAMLSLHKKKKKWRWKAVDIESIRH